MKELKAKAGCPFPLKSALFFYDEVDRKYEATWKLLCRGWDSAKRQRCLQKQIEYGSNFITYYLYHYDDPDCRVSPFVGNPSPADIVAGKMVWDWVEIAKWWPYLELGKLPGVWNVPTLFCGDSREATNNTAFHKAFIPPVVQSIHPYISGLNITSEASKTMSTAQMEAMIDVIRQAWTAAGQEQRFVGVHWQWNGRDRLPANADFLMYEFSWHPGTGLEKSVENVVDEAQRIVKASTLPVLFQEIAIESEATRAREQSRALRIPGSYMLPGPE